jgi:hypothetical protein
MSYETDQAESTQVHISKRNQRLQIRNEHIQGTRVVYA